jgi:Glyoxalase/Bleomycin resistance protein/Dioxygenase superfamily
MLDHVILNVSDYDGARAFYAQALEPLGVGVVMEFGQMCGFGEEGKPYLWVAERDEPSAPVHVALAAPDRATVEAFHTAAIAAGGTDNGAPGLRTTTRPTTAPSCSTRTATTSKPSATGRTSSLPDRAPSLAITRLRPLHWGPRGERSSVGRAPGCGPGGRRFESGRSPL